MLLFHEANPKPAKGPRVSSVEQTRISSSAWTRGFIVCGALFDVVSTLLPWGVTGLSVYLYLPWSIVIGRGVFLLASEFFTISVLIRAAAIVGWAGVVLYEYVERRALPYGVVLVSGFLSLTAVVMFATTGISLSWGAYLGLVGGVFMVLAGGVLNVAGRVVERLGSRKAVRR